MIRTIRRRTAPLIALTAALSSAVIVAQSTPTPTPSPQADQAAKPQASPDKQLIPIRVQVTISRFQDEKKTSSLPFMLWVNANGEMTYLRNGQNVPIPKGTPDSSVTYQPVGTNITCRAVAEGVRFRVSLTIEDSSVVPAKTAGGMVTVTSLSTSNSLLLRDGQSAEFVAATDKVTGEVTRIDVTVTALK